MSRRCVSGVKLGVIPSQKVVKLSYGLMMIDSASIRNVSHAPFGIAVGSGIPPAFRNRL